MPIHYAPRKISELKKSDSNVSLIGQIVQISKNEFTLQDETGRAEIFSEENVEQGRFVRVFCSMIEGNLKAEIVQSLNGFDLNLYNKTRELYNRAGL